MLSEIYSYVLEFLDPNIHANFKTEVLIVLRCAMGDFLVSCYNFENGVVLTTLNSRQPGQIQVFHQEKSFTVRLCY